MCCPREGGMAPAQMDAYICMYTDREGYQGYQTCLCAPARSSGLSLWIPIRVIRVIRVIRAIRAIRAIRVSRIEWVDYEG